jgi:hypothetical protein
MLPEKPHKRYPIVTVIGSTRFDKEIKEWAWEHTKKGYLILFAPFAKEEHVTDKINFETYRFLLEEQHFQKMELADIIFVFNKNDYIGTSTSEELQYARSLSKKIYFLEPSVKCLHTTMFRTSYEPIPETTAYIEYCIKCNKEIEKHYVSKTGVD